MHSRLALATAICLAAAPVSASEIHDAARAEVGTSQTPTITSVTENSASAFLRQQMAAAGGAITVGVLADALM